MKRQRRQTEATKRKISQKLKKAALIGSLGTAGAIGGTLYRQNLKKKSQHSENLYNEAVKGYENFIEENKGKVIYDNPKYEVHQSRIIDNWNSYGQKSHKYHNSSGVPIGGALIGGGVGAVLAVANKRRRKSNAKKKAPK